MDVLTLLLSLHTPQSPGPGLGGGSSPGAPLTEGIRFPELRSSGVALRSHTLKLPPSLGQKKLKAIEHLLTELAIGEGVAATWLMASVHLYRVTQKKW